MKVNRRALLKSAGTTLSLSAFPKIFGSRLADTPGRITVVFHGLFAFVVGTKNILAITPNNSDHTYCYLSRGGFKTMGGQYHWDGLPGMNPKPVPLPDKNAVLTATACGFTTDQVDTNGMSYCTLDLPFPDLNGMVPLRPFPNTKNILTLSGQYAGQIKTKYFPLVQAFTYSVTDMSAVFLRDKQGKEVWRPSSKAKVANLHIFAEAECPVQQDHAEQAFTQLAAMIHPNIADMKAKLAIQVGLPKVDSDTGIEDLWPEEEACLEERTDPQLCKGAHPGAGGGVRVVNCMNLVIT